MKIFTINILTDKEISALEDHANRQAWKVVSTQLQEQDLRALATQREQFSSWTEYVPSKVILQLPADVRQRLYCEVLDEYFKICRRSSTGLRDRPYTPRKAMHIMFTSHQIEWLGDVFHNFPWAHSSEFELNEGQFLSVIDRALNNESVESVGNICTLGRHMAEKWVAYTISERYQHWKRWCKNNDVG